MKNNLKDNLRDLSSINAARKKMGLKLISVHERKCMKCERKFQTISRNFCKNCRTIIEKFNLSDESYQTAEVYRPKTNHYVLRILM